MYKNLFSILSFKLTIQIFFLFLSNIFLSFLEVISIGSVPIFLSMLLEPNYNILSKINFEITHSFLQYFNSLDELIKIKYLLLSIFAIFLLKNFLYSVINFFSFKVAKNSKIYISSELFLYYLNRPYVFFLEKTSTSLLRNMDLAAGIPTIINLTLSCLKDIFLILSLVFIIFLTNKTIGGAIVLVLFFFCLFLFFKSIRITTKKGKKTSALIEEKYSVISNFFNSISEIKILDKKLFFFDEFNKKILQYENANQDISMMGMINRPIFEIISIACVCASIFYLFLSNLSIQQIIPLISLVALTMIRILPSVSSFFSNIITISFNYEHTREVLEQLNDKNKNCHDYLDAEKRILFKNSLELKNIYYTYPDSKIINISNINLKIYATDKIAIIGKNGSGKSTLINIITGLIGFSKGEIILDDDHCLKPKNNFLLKNAYLAKQDLFLLNKNVFHNVAFGISEENINKEKVIDCLKKVDLYNLFYKEKNIDKPIGDRGSKMSGGQKQLLNLARILYANPSFLILDEATSNLDYKMEDMYFSILNKLNITTLIIAHNKNILKYCNRIILIENGKIVDEGNNSYFEKKYDNLKNYIN
jgi:ABC-type bacteriocin/lantibiotic exporter with double-glycine peptidase domain